MVIELSEVQIGVNHTRGSIWKRKRDFRPKLHDIKFNYHFISAILKSQNLVSPSIDLI